MFSIYVSRDLNDEWKLIVCHLQCKSKCSDKFRSIPIRAVPCYIYITCSDSEKNGSKKKKDVRSLLSCLHGYKDYIIIEMLCVSCHHRFIYNLVRKSPHQKLLWIVQQLRAMQCNVFNKRNIRELLRQASGQKKRHLEIIMIAYVLVF